MKKIKIKKNKGFVLLFAVVLSSIILAITMSVLNISLKEINFSTSARETNESFFAADVGAECALFYDKTSSPDKNAFTGTAGSMTCAGHNITLVPSGSTFWSFTVPSLGSDGKGCAQVIVDKSTPPITKVFSKGYNVADSSCNPISTSVQRELELNY